MSDGRTLALALVGCGSVFETVCAAWPRIAAEDRQLHVMQLASTDAIAVDVAAFLSTLNASEVHVFAAIDQNALNHARLDAYASVRLRGFKCETLVHPGAIVEPDARIGENCWIGAGALIGAGVRIGNNAFVGTGARIDPGVQIGANAWVGPGAAIGQNARIGTHCVVGADVKLAANVVLGRHCSIDVPGAYADSLPDGSFIDGLFPEVVHIFGTAGARATG
jgi:UDP-3-O-[3-hydroxymyristoyl] glucosamine N-acyltransferase